MEETKKRKLDEMGNGQFDLNLSQPTSLSLSLSSSSSSSASMEELRALLDPLAKPQLTDLLVKLYAPTQNPFFWLMFMRSFNWCEVILLYEIFRFCFNRLQVLEFSWGLFSLW